METIKRRILASWLESARGDEARRLVDTLRPDGSWPDVDYQDGTRSGWRTPRHLSHVATLVRAYKSPQSDLRGSDEVRRAVFSSLDYWLEHDFQNSNWWWNQIGVPRALAPILLATEDELSDSERRRGLEILKRAKIGMTGQNLVWVTEITALRGILENDAALVDAAYRRIADEIRVTTGEGIQPDFSFHQHGPCLYNHGYGAAFVSDCSRIATQVAGTSFAFPPKKIATLASLILDGSQWMARGSVCDFGAEGREISRRGQSARYLGEAARNMLDLPTGREDEFRALEARALDRPAPPLEGNRHFWRSDMMTHHRAGYYASARMFSRRIANTDHPCNDEGLLSHHLADGCNVVLRTGGEYDEIFPAWDWQKIPGTTAEQLPELTGSPRRQGERTFVGGVSDGTYGLAAVDFALDALTARKSWFFFDQEYVCLGAGITCRSENAVVTTVNQCRLEGGVRAAEAGEVRDLEQGTHDLGSPAWVLHDEIAYVFLAPAQVRLRNESQEGNWSLINRSYPKTPVSREVFTLWIEHGRRPAGATYAYLVAPGIGASSVAEYTAQLPVDVLRNDAQTQAVWHKTLKIAGIAFYRAGRVEIRNDLSLAADTPCLVLLQERSGKLDVAVSNPKNEAATVSLEISGTLRGDGVEVLDNAARSRVTFDLPAGPHAGESTTRTFRRP